MRCASALIALLSLLACASVEKVQWFGKVGLPPRPGGHPVDVFLPGEDIERSYREIGTAVLRGTSFSSSDMLVEAAQTEARKRGGDAIILADHGEYIKKVRKEVPAPPEYRPLTATDVASGAYRAAPVEAGEVEYVLESEEVLPTLTVTVIQYTFE